jgi:hypothetical protein
MRTQNHQVIGREVAVDTIDGDLVLPGIFRVGHHINGERPDPANPIAHDKTAEGRLDRFQSAAAVLLPQRSYIGDDHFMNAHGCLLEEDRSTRPPIS